MPISPGDRLPDGELTIMTASGPAQVPVRDVFAGKRVVLFAVPGAFTPTCSQKHLPTYLAQYNALKAKGVDTIACLAVNDVHVLHAWSTSTGAGDRIMMLADGAATFTKALGMDTDLTRFGMGVRSRRFSALIEDGVVKEVNLDAPGEFKVSGADVVLCQV